ncbi:hypothetical protein CRD_01286 [Raphidiopsis brookii D9]|nr:hypothetical protein CRD_01286 [Raphidiopsis brookii D9]
MIYLPVSILLFLVLLLLLPFIWFALAVDIVEIAVAKLGFSPQIAFFLFLLIIITSTINIPLYRLENTIEVVDEFATLWLREFWGIPLRRLERSTVIALNVGGGLIPVLLALYQIPEETCWQSPW